MRTRILTLVLMGLAATLTGCAAGFRAGGDRPGVGVGAAGGRPAEPAYSPALPSRPLP